MTPAQRVRGGLAALCLGLSLVGCHRQSAPSGAATAAPPEDVMKPYLAIQEGLAKDSLEGLPANAAAMASGARHAGAPQLDADAAKLQSATTLADARAKFGTVSETLVSVAKTRGWVFGGGVREAWCPMANKPWVQRGSMIANPYFGKEMPGCGEFK